jgi:hypothetical protein
MVKSNLKAATAVAYTSEDTAEATLQYRPDAFLIHRPVQTNRYKPISKDAAGFRAVYFKKPYDTLPKDLQAALIECECTLAIIDGGVPHEQMPLFLNQFDVFIDQTTNPDLSKLCLEAMSCGLCTVTWKDRPHIKERVKELLSVERREMESQKNRQFIVDVYDASKVSAEVPRWLNQAHS